MATTTKTSKSAKGLAGRRSSAGTTNLSPLKTESVGDFATRAMYIYGSEVNEDRAIPSYQDGLKPVQRRLLWAASRVAMTKQKSALPVSEAMGRFHPHGDVGIYGALVNMVNNNVPIVTGLGGWGSLIDPPSAMRYTNCLLSKFGAEFIRKEYLAVTPRVPNYDSTMTEPLYLPALLPNIFVNPSSGIGVGVRSDIPAYTPKSLITMCVRVLNNEKLTPADWAKGLEFHEPWGGKLLRTKVNMAALRSFYETGNGSISFYAPVSLDETKKQIAIKYFVPGVRIESSDKKRNEKTATGNGKGAEQGLGLIDKIRRIAQVENVYTDGGLSYVVQIRRTTNMNECELLLKRIQTMLTAKQSFNVFTTVRKPAAEESYAVKFFNVAVPEVLVMWLKFRIKLEVDSLNWRIGEQEAAIAYTELLILVCSGLDKLIEILKRRLKDKDELRLAIQKAYKITSEQAKMVMVLQVHQLSRVDLDQQQLKLKEQQAELKSLQRDVKRPVHVVRTYLEAMADRFVLFNETNPQQQQWVLK
jgi:topoisomerase-4 subunit A